jgi:hypothetical protein
MSELSIALRLVVESGVLEGLNVVSGVEVGGEAGQKRVEILQWFNSKVVGERVELCVR